MAITISGVRITSLTINKAESSDQDSAGGRKVYGSYELMSSNDKVLATQSFGHTYSAMKIPYSSETIAALEALMTSIRRDLNTALGIEA